jgi:WD40 repeat protein
VLGFDGLDCARVEPSNWVMPIYTDRSHTLVGLLGLSPSYLVSAAADSTLRIWDPDTGEL